MLETEVKEIEEEKEELPEELETPFNPKDIDITTQQISLDAIINRLKEGEIDLNTDFQRHADLWSKQTQSRLIESILIRFPLPAFYFDTSDDDNWLIVDGLQRLSTLSNFVLAKENPLKLTGLEFLTEYDGITYEKLPRTMKRRIKETPITAYMIRPGTPDDVKYCLFSRINTGGLVLKSQEIRHALNQKGNSVKVLKEIAEDKRFKDIVSVSDKRMQDRELVLRFFSFRLKKYTDYKPPMSKFLNDTMKSINHLGTNNIIQIKNSFFSALDTSYKLFSEDLFSKSLVTKDAKKVLNRGLFEVWTVLLSQLSENEIKNLLTHKEKIIQEFISLLKDRNFDRFITSSTTGKAQVTLRFEKINELIKRNIN